jgi:hypothetical protein
MKLGFANTEEMPECSVLTERTEVLQVDRTTSSECYSAVLLSRRSEYE